MLRQTLILLSTLLLAGQVPAQECHPRIKLTAPQSRFVINPDGTATDSWTGLIWQCCPLGTRFDDQQTNTPSDDICVVEGEYQRNW
jgi:hypothetical protein